LRKALKRGEFIGYVQPVFDLKTQAFTGGEALARWQRSDGSLVPPVEFIGLAEDSGLIVPITWQMMDNTLSQLSDYLRERPAMRIGFNIAPKHLMSAGFADELCARLDEHGVRYEQIIIEITERQPFEDILSAEIVIQKLRELGFVMSLDDTKPNAVTQAKPVRQSLCSLHKSRSVGRNALPYCHRSANRGELRPMPLAQISTHRRVKPMDDAARPSIGEMETAKQANPKNNKAAAS
jgi:hypothetical protein